MSPRYITEFVATQPTVVVFGASGSSLVRLLTEKIRNLEMRPEIIDPAVSIIEVELLEKSYKIIWVNEEKERKSGRYKAIISSLANYASKTAVVQPVLSSIDENYSGKESFAKEWIRENKKIKEIILDINFKLQGASFIFGQDILEETNYTLSPLSYMLNRLVSGNIDDPSVKLGLQSTESFINAVVELAFIPDGRGSFLIRPNLSGSTKVLGEIRDKYEQYHSVVITVHKKPLQKGEGLPFSTKRVGSDGVDDEDISNFVRSLPSPILVDIKKKERKKRGGGLFGLGLGGESDDFAGSDKNNELGIFLKYHGQNDAKSSLENNEGEGGFGDSRYGNDAGDGNLEIDQDLQELSSETVVGDELQKIFSETRKNKKASLLNKKVITEKKQTRKGKQRGILFVGGVLSTVFATSTIILAVIYLSTLHLAKQALLTVVNASVGSDLAQLVQGDDWSKLVKVNNKLEMQRDIYEKVLSESMFSQADMILDLTKQIAEMSEDSGQGDELAETLILRLLGSEPGSVFVATNELVGEMDKNYARLSTIQAGLGQIDLSDPNDGSSKTKYGGLLGAGDSNLNNLFTTYEEQVQGVRQSLTTLQQLKEHLPEILGENAQKTYIILLQNNQELRPTGGFIQAVAVVRFKNGVLSSSKVMSSYDIDKKFKGEVDSPEEIKKYLGENSWYFHDSNWNPHFPDTARQAAWFVEQTTKDKPDGVFAINLDTVGDLIDVYGELALDEYNEVVTGKNLAERMLFHAEDSLNPENGKKDYGVVILEKLLDNIKNTPRNKAIPLASAINKNLNSQQLLVTIFDEKIQDSLGNLGWNGAMVEPQCPSQFNKEECVVDEIAQAEANIAINKANYYLKRKIEQNISLGAGSVDHQRIITYQNESSTDTWPQGAYKAYVRFYLPEKAKLKNIIFDSKTITRGKIRQYKESGRRVVGVEIEVPVSSTKKLELNYSTPLPTEKTPFSYVFFDQKQPGTSGTETTVRLVSPSQFAPVLIAPKAEVLDNTIIFEDIQDKHSMVGVSYQ